MAIFCKVCGHHSLTNIGSVDSGMPQFMLLALPAPLHGQHSSNITDVANEEEGDATLAVHAHLAIPVEGT